MLYLCEGDGVDHRVRILSPRRFPAYPSPQQRDTRSLSAFQKRIYGNWAKKLRTYVPTTPPGRVIYKWLCRGFAYRRLSRSALGRSPPPSAVFKIIVVEGKKIRTRSACFCDLSFDKFYMLVIGRIASIPASPILRASTTNWNLSA